MKYTLLLCLLFTTMQIEAKPQLLDKIAAIVDEHIITLSEINRIKSNLMARKSIAPMIYSRTNYSAKEITNIIINKFLIRSYLQTLGYIISDEQVDSQIEQTQKRLHLTKQQLLDFLQNNNISYKEYFELTRETIEYMSLFVPRVILPLVSISDYELKNYYYSKHKNRQTMSFRYTLNDFSIAKSKVSPSDLKNIDNILLNFQITGNLPSNLQDIDTNVIQDVSEDGLMPAIRKALASTAEGHFAPPIVLNGDYHFFFIKKKDIGESEDFLENKKKLKAELKEKKINEIISSWISREKFKHYIKILL